MKIKKLVSIGVIILTLILISIFIFYKKSSWLNFLKGELPNSLGSCVNLSPQNQNEIDNLLITAQNQWETLSLAENYFKNFVDNIKKIEIKIGKGRLTRKNNCPEESIFINNTLGLSQSIGICLDQYQDSLLLTEILIDNIQKNELKNLISNYKASSLQIDDFKIKNRTELLNFDTSIKKLNQKINDLSLQNCQIENMNIFNELNSKLELIQKISSPNIDI
jgi:hypothetical protein